MMNSGPRRDDLKMESRRSVSGEESPISQIFGIHSLDAAGDIREVMKLYDLEGEEKKTEVHQKIDLGLFQMEDD